ncbi:PipX family protein [Spirulina major CS-329]|uniref:transcriptional coactivator PipX n=1 Tax=Spirulina TaxID=1154 RepID=UPI00232FA577|nr:MULTISPECIES: PipX family protein [Spirulina]MDB9493125.1 PipX family protein [Spirulina subsalsa CS-330]MDB9501893.1 PipX family protein [Spirulina major CS-329]
MKSNETYLNHPTFGLLFKVCPIEDNQELYTTLYAQRLFFVVSQATHGLAFEPLGRSDARLLVENRLRKLRRINALEDYQDLNLIYKRTFQ